MIQEYFAQGRLKGHRQALDQYEPLGASFGRADRVADCDSIVRSSAVASRIERLRFIGSCLDKRHLADMAKSLIVSIQKRITTENRR